MNAGESFWGVPAATVRERFEAKLSADTAAGCLVWIGATNRNGYGELSLIVRRRRFRILAHRLSWELAHGPIPGGLLVLHRCDNPPCVNLAHLFLGTQQDNVADMWTKGRGVPPQAPPVLRGEQSNFARITAATALAIFQSPDVPGTELSRRHGVSQQQVCNIRKGRAWRHVTGWSQ